MKAIAFAILIGSVGTLPTLGQTAPACGVDRWSVKTLADPDASKIDKTPVEVTMDSLVKLTRPEKVDATLPRAPGTETTTYKLNATLTLYKQENDSDYHLVLEDDHDNTMIVEIPDPACVAKNSPALAEITKVRQKFDQEFKASPDKQATKIPVTVVGVGFFDLVHGGSGQIGHADNNIELHPVLDIQFNGPKPPGFEPTTATANSKVQTKMPTESFPYEILLMWSVISIGMTVLYIVAIRETVGTLRRSNDWSLSKALQEADGKPSSSRLIAFLGLLILMVLYMELGYLLIWRLLNNEEIPNVQPFLLTGLSLFAPYAFNQIKQFALNVGSKSDGSSNNSARIAHNAPKVLAVTPNAIGADAPVEITVTGSGFDPRPTVWLTKWITNDGGAIPISPTLMTPTLILFNITMPRGVAPYLATVHILNSDGGQATGTFQVN